MYIDPEVLLDVKNHLSINPLRYGEERCAGGQTWKSDVREYYLLHYIISGKGTYITPASAFDVNAGQIFVIFPGEVTTYAADNLDPWHYYWVGFESSVGLEDIFTSYIIDAQECAHIFHAIVNNSPSIGKKEWYVSGKIYELLTFLGSRGDNGSNNRDYRYIQLAVEYIAANYREKINIADLAKHLSLSHSYFTRIFRAYMGKTPQRYLVDFRLDKAAEHLSTMQCTRAEAANEAGYTDIVNFSRMFSRKFGVPPCVYRSEKRQQASKK